MRNKSERKEGRLQRSRRRKEKGRKAETGGREEGRKEGRQGRGRKERKIACVLSVLCVSGEKKGREI